MHVIIHSIMGFVGIEKFSLVDYDGKVSCVLFAEKCNFRCPFCHNATLVYDNNQAIFPFEEILTYLEKRRKTIDAVVISGGEPTLMSDLIDKISKIKLMGFCIKLDTNGSRPEIIKKLIDLKLVDYIAMDIKNSFEKYPFTIGTNFDLSKIQQSITLLLNSSIDYEFRTTLVSEFHDSTSILLMAKEIAGAKKIFLQKFIDHGTCIKSNLHEVNIKMAQEFVKILKPYVNQVFLRGY